MATRRTPDGFPVRQLFDLYARYAGEPESRMEVMSYWTFVVGALVSFLGVVVFLLGPTSPPSPNYFVREVAIAMAAFGLPVALFGILLLFPVKRQGIYAAAGGTALSLGAVVGFLIIYPNNWVVETPDYSGTLISVYTVGVAVIVGVAGLVPLVTGEKSFFFTQEYQREGEYPGVMVGEADRDGLFSVFRSSDEWGWRLIEQNAVAAGTERYLSRLQSEEAVEELKRQVENAGLMEIKSAAFRLYEASEDRWRWLLMLGDGSVVADSGESFDDRENAATSVNELKEYGPDADLLRIEGAAFDYEADAGEWRWRLVDEDRNTLVEGAETFDTREAAEAASRNVQARATDADILVIEAYGVELFEDDGWHWRLLDADERELARGADAFASRRDAEAGVQTILDGLAGAPILDRDQPTYEVTPAGSDWDWRLVSAEERIVARSNGPVGSERGARQRAERMAGDAADATLVVIEEADFEYYRGADGWRWRLVTTDRESIAESASPFESREAVEGVIEGVKIQASQADLIEYEDAAFQVYETDGEWRWRLIDEDGNVMADSGAEHDSRDSAMTSMLTVKENAPNADLLEIETAAFELFERDGEWNWRLVDESGETTAQGTAWHDSREAAHEAMDRLAGQASVSRARAMEASVFQLYVEGDDWCWRFVRPDGTVLAECATTYGTRDEAESAIEEEIRNVAAAGVVRTIESVAVELFERSDRWQWRLLDRDRAELGRSSGSFESHEEAVETIEGVQANVAEITVFERKETTFLLTGEPGAWRWTLVGEDHTALATPGAPFEQREDAEAAIDRVKALIPEAGTIEYEDAAFDVFQDGETWHWRLIDEGEAVIAAGADGYATREDAAEAVESVKAAVDDASILEIDTAAFELHEDSGEWHWRLLSANGTTLAESLRTYSSRREAREAMDTVKEFAPTSLTQVAE